MRVLDFAVMEWIMYLMSVLVIIVDVKWKLDSPHYYPQKNYWADYCRLLTSAHC